MPTGRPCCRYNRGMTPADQPNLHFILGGARSGKSAFAERLALQHGGPVTYIATARVGDREFAERVALHRARRPAHWTLVEEPLDLAGALDAAGQRGQVVLIDCLTLWLLNLICPPAAEPQAGDDVQGIDPAQPAQDQPPPGWQDRLDAFAAALARAQAQVLVVSNEIGLGVVPMGALTRLYVDELGRLNQRIAAACGQATLMVAGLPLALKPAPPA